MAINLQLLGKKEIIDRGKALFNIAEKIWPFPDVIPEEELSYESYNLLDDIDEIDFSSTKPLKYKFDDQEEIYVNSWATLYQGFMDKLYNLNKDSFLSFMSSENYCGSTIRKLLSKDTNDLRYPGRISDDYYLEMNQNTMRKIKVLKTLLIDM